MLSTVFCTVLLNIIERTFLSASSSCVGISLGMHHRRNSRLKELLRAGFLQPCSLHCNSTVFYRDACLVRSHLTFFSLAAAGLIGLCLRYLGFSTKATPAHAIVLVCISSPQRQSFCGVRATGRGIVCRFYRSAIFGRRLLSEASPDVVVFSVVDAAIVADLSKPPTTSTFCCRHCWHYREFSVKSAVGPKLYGARCLHLDCP